MAAKPTVRWNEGGGSVDGVGALARRFSAQG